MKKIPFIEIKQFFTKKGAQRDILFRSFFFLLSIFAYSILRTLYIDHYYHYGVSIADGFVKYNFYALAILFYFVNFEKIKETKNLSVNTVEMLLSLVFAFGLFFLPATIFHFRQDILVMLFEYTLGFLSGFALFILFFGISFFKRFFHEIVFLVLILIPLKLSPILVDQFWKYFSTVTLWGLKPLLSLTQVSHSINTSTYNVSLLDFRVLIGPSCAGVHSLVAFVLLFVFTLFLMLQKNYKMRGLFVALMFFLGLLAVFILNSIRVFLILLVGAYYSKDFAINAFHNNIGATLFLIFFMLYITFFLKKAIKQAPKK